MSAAPESERARVLQEFTSRGWPADEARASIQIESGWDPSAHNSIRAGGLIGFLPSTLAKLGWPSSPEAFWRLSASEQAPWIGKYLDAMGRRWGRPGDTYLLLAAPSAVNDSDDKVVYRRGSKAWQQNPGWRPPDGGDITAGSIRSVVLRRMERGMSPGPERVSKRSSAVPFGLLCFAGVLLWQLTKRGRHARA